MDQVTIVILNGLLFASYLFLVSAGLTFIYGVMRILNVAHGSLYGLGAYTGAWLLSFERGNPLLTSGVTRSRAPNSVLSPQSSVLAFVTAF